MLNRINTQALQSHDIAEMTNDQIAQLNYDEMIDVVLASQMPVRNVERIHSFEGETVYRLVYSARRHCRQAVEHAS